MLYSLDGIMTKLNLGCGNNLLAGYTNVDKFSPSETPKEFDHLVYDLEEFPWPWVDSSVQEIVLTHVLEHLGGTTECYLKIIQEMYRVCCHDALIHIAVPHPRHDDFLTDPTHVRAITPESLLLFNKEVNHQYIEQKSSNSLLAIYLDVDFVPTSVKFIRDPEWKDATPAEVMQALRRYNNVIKEIQISLRVNKNVTTAEDHGTTTA